MKSGEKVKISGETEVNPTEFASILGISFQRVYQMIEQGRLKKSGRGRLPLGENIQLYFAYKSRDFTDEDTKEIEKKRLAADAALKASKARISEMNEDELRGKLHRSEDVEAMTADLVYAVRGALMALPGRLAADMAAATTPAEAADKIRKEIFLAMQDLTKYQYDPLKYQERVRERQKWELEHAPENENEVE